MNPTRRLGLRLSRPELHPTIDEHMTEILAMSEATRPNALKAWYDELDASVSHHTRQSANRLQKLPGRINIYFKAFLAVVMAVASIYFLIATLNLPYFPGWGIVNDLSFNIGPIEFDTLGYVGLTFGWTAIALSRLAILLLQNDDQRWDADRKISFYISDLQEKTAGRSRRYYRLRWCLEVWLGNIPWIGIIAVILDLAFGYVLAEKLISMGYHHGQVAGVIHNALIAIAQMPLGGGMWFIRSVVLYGLASREEKAIGWIKSQQEQIGEQDTATWVEQWKRLRVKRNLLLWGPLCGYLSIAFLFYSGFLAKSNLTSIEGLVVGVMLAICGIFAGMFFAGMTSRVLGKLQGVNTPKQKVLRARKDIKQAFFSMPVTAQSLFGSLVVQLFGHGYTPTNSAVLGGSYQQGYQDVVGLVFNYIESGEEGKRRVTAFLNRRLPWLLPVLAFLIKLVSRVPRRRKARNVTEGPSNTEEHRAPALQIGATDPSSAEGEPGEPALDLTNLPVPQISAGSNASAQIAALLSNLQEQVQATGQRWTDEMGQAAQAKSDLERSIRELGERLIGTSLDDLYLNPQQLTDRQEEATRLQAQLTTSIQEHLSNAQVAQQTLLNAQQFLGGTGSNEEHTSE
jgi:hypothetical protein